MGTMIDLRKYNINSDAEAIEFLELFISKAPRIVKLIKGHQLEKQGLLSQVGQMQQVAVQAQAQPVEGGDYSVSERMKGSSTVVSRPVSTATILTSPEDRIAQMRAAKEAEITPVADPLNLPAPEDVVVEPGEIGSIAPDNLQTINNTAAEETSPEAGLDPSDVSLDLPTEPEVEPVVDTPTLVARYAIQEDDMVYSQDQVGEDLVQHIVHADGQSTYLRGGYGITYDEYKELIPIDDLEEPQV